MIRTGSERHRMDGSSNNGCGGFLATSAATQQTSDNFQETSGKTVKPEPLPLSPAVKGRSLIKQNFRLALQMWAGAVPGRKRWVGGGGGVVVRSSGARIHLKMSELHRAAQAGTDIKHSRGESLLSDFF